ncbi:uncharacterized protein LOC110441677 [Mizuhopecten yessoensis]|nr:uncharacterized protein LOC110441677 [Mizuhopecten yessoensis]
MNSITSQIISRHSIATISTVRATELSERSQSLIMDSSYLPRRRVRPDKGNPPKVGGCDFCYQKNVKIRPLECHSHFYCQVCEEFCPKIRKGDFTCRKCSHRTRVLDDENRKRVDDFYVKQEGLAKPKGFQEVIISIDGANIISFNDDDDEEDGDLSGNNTEWDFLLQSLTSKDRKENDKGATKGSDNLKTNKTETEKRTGSKKQKPENSKLSSDGSDTSSSLTSFDQIGVTGFRIKPEIENPSSTLEVSSFPEQGSNSPIVTPTTGLLPVPEGRHGFDSDSLSERGTSPVKPPPKMLDAASWLGLRRLTARDDSTNPIELYTAEGTSFRGRKASPGGSQDGSTFGQDIIHGDDFWDF